MRIGTAGWSIPREAAAAFPGEGAHLERYARTLACVEVNSSFYRSHRRDTWARWAAQTPDGFRFSAKVPRAITHDARLLGAREPLERFLGEAAGLGEKLAVLLVQLPPSFAWDGRRAGAFFRLLHGLFPGSVVCEPRHASWLTPRADEALARWEVSRVAADPARWPEAAHPGGLAARDRAAPGAVPYFRWHGSPRMYWSRYDAAWLAARDAELASWPAGAAPWCIFDNTASGAATSNALELRALDRRRGVTDP